MTLNAFLELDNQQSKKDFSFKCIYDFSPPPFIGCILSDKEGKTIALFESHKGALEFYLKKNMKDPLRSECFNIELIPMFISALERFSEEINIQDVPCINLKGSNIKLHSIFDLDNFTVIFFLNPFIHIKSFENLIYNYFIELYEEYKNEFQDIKKLSSINFISHLENLGMEWVTHLNNLYFEKSL
ncbi:MAG: hypothetical protein ACFFC3_06250 [Candidatus Odinarchaeota archaeon]